MKYIILTALTFSTLLAQINVVRAPFGPSNPSGSFTSATSVTITHNLNTTDIIVQCYNASNQPFDHTSLSGITSNAVTINFATNTGKCVINGTGGPGPAGATGPAGPAGAGTGDASSVETSSADNQGVAFADNTGKIIKKSTLTGIIKETSGIRAAATAGTDYVSPAGLQAGTAIYVRSTSGNDTYVGATSPALTTYTTGMVVVLNGDTANTGAATINISSLGAKSILNNDGSALADGSISANKPVTLVYDGTQFVIATPGAVGVVTGDTGTVTVDPVTRKVDADITEIMAQPLAPTSSFDVSGATVTKAFKRVTSAPSGACDGSENAIQMVASTGAKWRCDETTDTWVSDAPAVTTFIPLMMGSSVFTDGFFFAGPPNGAQTATNVYPYHYYNLADSATHRIGWQIPAPASLPSTVNVYFDIYQADDNGGDVRVRITTACIAVSSAVGASPTIVGTSTQTVTMPSVYQAGARVTATGLSTSGCASQHMYVAIERLGSDAADTMTNALRVHGGMLTWQN